MRAPTLAEARNGIADAVRVAARRDGTPPYVVADVAPATLADVVRTLSETGRLVVWGGASDGGLLDPATNYMFRAWHDFQHVRTGIGFEPAAEIELASIQAAGCPDALARVVLIEVADQARHFAETGEYVADQAGFALARLGRG